MNDTEHWRTSMGEFTRRQLFRSTFLLGAGGIALVGQGETALATEKPQESSRASGGAFLEFSNHDQRAVDLCERLEADGFAEEEGRAEVLRQFGISRSGDWAAADVVWGYFSRRDGQRALATHVVASEVEEFRKRPSQAYVWSDHDPSGIAYTIQSFGDTTGRPT